MNKDAEYKPKDCRYCYFWEGRKGCTFTWRGKPDCYYADHEEPPLIESECKSCPFGNPRICVGWCTKQLLQHFGLWKGGDAS